MNVRYLIFVPCMVLSFVAIFFLGMRLTPTKTVQADDTLINFSTSTPCVFTYGGTDYAYPDYCSKVLITIKNLANTSIASAVFTFSGDITSTTFSIAGAFSNNTYYRMETNLPTYGEITFTELGNRDAGVFKYTTSMTFHFVYTVTSDKWFTQIGTPNS